jgi:hypothetical protein
MLQLQFEPGSIPEAWTCATREGRVASVAGRATATGVALSGDGLTPDATTCRAALSAPWVAVGGEGTLPATDTVRAMAAPQIARARTQASLEKRVRRFLGSSTMC